MELEWRKGDWRPETGDRREVESWNLEMPKSFPESKTGGVGVEKERKREEMTNDQFPMTKTG